MPLAVSSVGSMAVGNLEAFAYRSFEVPQGPATVDRTVLPVYQGELLRAAETLHKHYLYDPVAQYLIDPVKDCEKRDSLHRRYFQIFTNLTHLRGSVHQVNDFGGVILWYPPTAVSRGTSALHLVRSGFLDVFRHIGLEGVRRLVHEYVPLSEQVKARAAGKAASLYYIFLMGVAPRQRDCDLFPPLLEHVLREADEAHLPCMAECTQEALLPVYFSFGFSLYEMHRLGKGASVETVTIWFLLREPYATGTAHPTTYPEALDSYMGAMESPADYASVHRQSPATVIGGSEYRLRGQNHPSLPPMARDKRLSAIVHDEDSEGYGRRPRSSDQCATLPRHSDAAGGSPGTPRVKKRRSLFGLNTLKIWASSSRSAATTGTGPQVSRLSRHVGAGASGGGSSWRDSAHRFFSLGATESNIPTVTRPIEYKAANVPIPQASSASTALPALSINRAVKVANLTVTTPGYDARGAWAERSADSLAHYRCPTIAANALDKGTSPYRTPNHQGTHSPSLHQSPAHTRSSSPHNSGLHNHSSPLGLETLSPTLLTPLKPTIPRHDASASSVRRSQPTTPTYSATPPQPSPLSQTHHFQEEAELLTPTSLSRRSLDYPGSPPTLAPLAGLGFGDGNGLEDAMGSKSAYQFVSTYFD
ncbi:hypothetical protein IWQ60_010681 [Tieghemiomyces parasiticus]|uniref:Uncharacterized protein n=1 Tax=Tieghemiomyces parasiticus TaxID=78921 RepID=A0A9W7ZQV2_9FUNG|nr:hypothetical protein IWQ60_010681 [Tieghemiomyces parasiticus]